MPATPARTSRETSLLLGFLLGFGGFAELRVQGGRLLPQNLPYLCGLRELGEDCLPELLALLLGQRLQLFVIVGPDPHGLDLLIASIDKMNDMKRTTAFPSRLPAFHAQ